MTYKYEIFQIDEKLPNAHFKMFLDFKWLLEKFGKFDINDYKKTYEGTIEGLDALYVLEDLFEIFNIRHPEDFRGHSLSVSDVVKLDDKFYYCDSMGWKTL